MSLCTHSLLCNILNIYVPFLGNQISRVSLHLLPNLINNPIYYKSITHLEICKSSAMSVCPELNRDNFNKDVAIDFRIQT